MRTPKSQSIRRSTYTALLSSIRHEISTSEERLRDLIEKQKTETYWNVGKQIKEYLNQNPDDVGYSKKTYEKLSADLNIASRTLYQTVQFYERYPILSARSKLHWSHYRKLIGIKDEEKREELTKKAEAENLSSRELEQLVQETKEAKPRSSQPATLSTERGQFNTYRLKNIEFFNYRKNRLGIDCGFNIYPNIKLTNLKKYADGDIVTTIKEKSSYRLNDSSANYNHIYTYIATIVGFPGNDVMDVNIDLGFDILLRTEIRLHGIKPMEKDSKEGKKCRSFLIRTLGDLPFIVIKTYRKNKNDRHLSDVYFDARSKDPKKVLEAGTYLNQLLLDKGIARTPGVKLTVN